MQQFTRADDRLLVREQQALAGRAAARVGISPAAPTIAASTVSASSALRDLRQRRRAERGLRRQPARRSAARSAGFAVPGRRSLRRADGNARRGRASSFDSRLRRQRMNTEAFGMARDHIERARADRAGRAEDVTVRIMWRP